MLNIVHEDEHLLVVNKPAGLVCHPTKGDVYSSLVSRVRLHLDAEKAGVRPHLINRLDRETSGLVVVAKTDEFALMLRRKWELGEVGKTYVAVVEGRMADAEGCIDLPIGPDTESRVVIKGRVVAGGSPSQTWFQRAHVFSREGTEFSILRVSPKTGRKHQIRIHLAHIGYPIVGDKIYGPDERCYLALIDGTLDAGQWERLRLPNHALHAGGLRWRMNSQDVEYIVEPETVMADFVSAGDPPFSGTWFPCPG